MICAIFRSLRPAAFVALTFIALTAPAAAQTPPTSGADLLEWEVVGQPFDEWDLWPDADDIAFAGDTAVYTPAGEGLHALHPGGETWTLRYQYIRSGSLYVTSTGTLFTIEQDMLRSTDGGYTWGDYLPQVHAVIELPSDALVASQDGYGVARSTDGGASWTNHGGGTPLFNALFARGFAYAPPSPKRVEGVLVTVGVGGAAYSRDEGQTWASSNLLGEFGYRGYYVVYSAHDDTLYAVINGEPGDGGSPLGLVWASADGETWELRGRIPTGGDESPGQVVAAPDGVLWAILPGDVSGRVFPSGHVSGQVYASGDGGRTWGSRGWPDGEALVGNGVRLSRLRLGPQGRLWLAVVGWPNGPDYTGAVLRTAAPVTAAAAPGALGEPGVELGAPYPNPSGGSVTLPLRLDRATEVRVVAYDALGRAVRVLHEGPLTAGHHRLALGVDLPAGVYVVRATSDGFDTSQRLTLVE
jgi:hypothetical protein